MVTWLYSLPMSASIVCFQAARPPVGVEISPPPSSGRGLFFRSWRPGLQQSKRIGRARNVGPVRGMMPPVDPWAPGMNSQSIASQLFAASIFPYVGFLYFITKSKTAPKLTLFGFYFLLVFVGVTIPAGIYAKVHYGTSLSNVDWLHGGAESMLTLTNLFIVLGLREGLRNNGRAEEVNSSDLKPDVKQEQESSI